MNTSSPAVCVPANVRVSISPLTVATIFDPLAITFKAAAAPWLSVTLVTSKNSSPIRTANAAE